MRLCAELRPICHLCLAVTAACTVFDLRVGSAMNELWISNYQYDVGYKGMIYEFMIMIYDIRLWFMNYEYGIRYESMVYRV